MNKSQLLVRLLENVAAKIRAPWYNGDVEEERRLTTYFYSLLPTAEAGAGCSLRFEGVNAGGNYD